MRSLFQNLVPPLVQSAEPLPNRRLRGLVYRQNGEMMAYVEGTTGPHGIFLHPLVHPDLTEYGRSGALADAAACRGSAARFTWRCARTRPGSKTPWQTCRRRPAPRQALLVKHLATLQRVPAERPPGCRKTLVGSTDGSP